MDVNEALTAARALAEDVLRRPAESTEAQALAEAFLAIDGWITGGGFLPAAWRHPDA